MLLIFDQLLQRLKYLFHFGGVIFTHHVIILFGLSAAAAVFIIYYFIRRDFDDWKNIYLKIHQNAQYYTHVASWAANAN